MTEDTARVERDRTMINEARERGTGPKLWAYSKLSGPGWLQGAITLGGGSLAGSLYLGVLTGYGLMWLQPLAMIMGIIMLSAIGYVTLSTGERPFDAINRHINPVLGWGWAIATLMANLVWCMPQFALGTAAIQQNLAPGLFEGDNALLPDPYGKRVVVAFLFIVSGTVVWFYDSGNWGIKLFEILLKVMVGVIILCFVGVVVAMSLSDDGLAWEQILGGFIPDFSLLNQPAVAFRDTLAETGKFSEFWTTYLVAEQKRVMITAVATAVGINMTFLLPYSMLRRGWDRDFRGLASFDLSTGLFIPFLLATSCVVIASASRFHAEPAAGFLGETDKNGVPMMPAANLVGKFNKLVDKRIKEQLGPQKFDEIKDDDAKLEAARRTLPMADRRLAAMIVKRDTSNMAASLQPLTGKNFSHYVFGVGVIGMAISTIIILMLINGFVVCEILGLPSRGTAHRIGCFMAAGTGAMGPFLWGDENAKLWLAVPTSMFGMVLLPIAYFTFLMMMNSRSLLGDSVPKGGKRIVWNVLMGAAASLAAFGSYWSIRTGGHPMLGSIVLGLFVLTAVIVHFVCPRQTNSQADAE